MDDPALKLKYNKSKLKLKLWESEFTKKTGNKPSKDDIKEAPSEIRDAYKWYWQIKIHAIGQDSMLDATFLEKKNLAESFLPSVNSDFSKSTVEDGQIFSDKQEVNVQVTPSLQDASLQLPEEIKNTSTLIEDKPKIQKDSDSQPSGCEQTPVWGSHLNRCKSLETEPSKKNLSRSSSSFQLSEKLFVGAKLKKRNPRKSISFSLGRGKDKGTLFSSDSLPGPSDSSFSTENSQGQEDGFPISDLEKEMNAVGEKEQQNHNFVVVKGRISSAMQPVSAIQKMIDGDMMSANLKTERNLDKGWLERVMQADINLSLEAKDNKSTFHSSQSEATFDPSFSKEDSDDDIVYGSDNESMSPRKVEKENRVRLALRSIVAKDSPSIITAQVEDEKARVSPMQVNLKKRKLDAIEAAMAMLTEKRKSEKNTSQRVKRPKISNESNRGTDDEVDENSKDSGPTLRKKTTKSVMSKKEVLEKKVASGTVNDNFVRINMKKKVFVRGKKTMNFQKYKKQQWKNKKKELSEQASAYISRMDPGDSAAGGGLQKCFQCGDVGHFARQCTKLKGDSLIPYDKEDEEESPFPSLAEVEKMAREKSDFVHFRRRNHVIETNSVSAESISNETLFVGDGGSAEDAKSEVSEDKSNSSHDESSDITDIMKLPKHEPERNFGLVEPLYPLNGDGSIIDTPSEVYDCLHKFGHQHFRPGQEVAIMRILSGLSTLVTLSTGSGKSLCYQLPAYLFASRKNCITLVVSPLVSLMDDQISGLPSFINGAALHTGQTVKQREKVMELAKSGKLQFLLVSPEAVVAGERQSGFGGLLRSLPNIAFACIDEAHCVSQWSHNFRPSYLVIFKVLREKLGVQTVLGLTATATQTAVSSIIDHMGIPDGRQGVIQDTPLPNNLLLTVSHDSNRDQALIQLLSSSEFKNFKSIIVYCTRQKECERLAALIRTCLKSPTEGKGKISTVSEAYHAGFSAARRKQVQTAFMSGILRIVVATVAFGMGINKADIRSVVHFNMPCNFESYVQEVGRAGRDGEMSRCHLFLNSEGKDLNELKRHIHADAVDRHSIRKLLQRVFVPCKCGESPNNTDQESSDVAKHLDASGSVEINHEKKPVKCNGHEVAFSVDETVAALDLPEENITTLLCYLELHDKNLLQVMPKAYTHCRILSYKGIKHIRDVARTCPPLAMAIAMDFMSGESQKASHRVEFPVVEIASAIGWDSGIVKRELHNLEWTTINGNSRRSGLKVEFYNLGFRVRAPGNLSPERLDAALDFLHDRVVKQEQSALSQLQSIFYAVTSVSFSCVKSMLESTESVLDTRSNSLKCIVRAYFQDENKTGFNELKSEEKLENGEQIASDIRQMVGMYRDCTFTGRAMARIFHGISSPNFPAQVWGRCRFWRAHLDSDFKLICLLATRVLLKMR